METYTYQQQLPSCILNRNLLVDIEKRLLIGIPKLLNKGLRKILQGLGLDDHHKLETYRVVINSRKMSRTLHCSRELETAWFEPGTREVKIEYYLGAPRIIAVEIVFPQNGRPTIMMSTQSPQVERLLPNIALGLCGAIDMYVNRHKLLHNPVVQSCLMLAVPALVMFYGLFSGVDILLLYASMGWLCLLSLGMTMSLPRLFPWVTFEMQRRFQLSRLPLLAKVSLLCVAIGCYISLILLNLPHTGPPPAIMLASLGG